MTDDHLVGWLQETAAQCDASEPIAMLVRDEDDGAPFRRLRSEKQLAAELRKKIAGAETDDKRILLFLFLDRVTQFDKKYGSAALSTEYCECGELVDAIIACIERDAPISDECIAAVDRMIQEVNDEERVFINAPLGLAILTYSFAVNLDRQLGPLLDRIPRDVRAYFVDWARDYAAVELAKEEALASLMYRRELQAILDLWPEWKSGIEKQRTRRN